MTDDSRSGGRDGSGARNHGGNRSGGAGGRGGGGGRSRSGFGGERGGSDRRGGQGGGRQQGGRSGSRDGEGRREWSGRNRDDRTERRGEGTPGEGGQKQHGGERDFRSDDRRRGDRFGRRDRDDRRPRREDRDRRGDKERDPRDAAPPLPESVSYSTLDADVRRELNSLPKSLAEIVGRHLVAAGTLLDEDPEAAYRHASYARRKASRVAAVREASGVAAYIMGKWQEALSDLRAARRMSGRNSFLAVMADCERGLGRAERALEITHDPAASELEIEEQVELRIVAAGARRDLGQVEAALVELQIPELKERRARPWVARLFYAYADVLEELGRSEDAREYFARASAVDREGATDADERLAALEGVELVDSEDGIVWTDAEDLAAEDPAAGDRPREEGPREPRRGADGQPGRG